MECGDWVRVGDRLLLTGGGLMVGGVIGGLLGQLLAPAEVGWQPLWPERDPARPGR